MAKIIAIVMMHLEEKKNKNADLDYGNSSL